MVKATAACLHRVVLAPKPFLKATAACLHRVFLGWRVGEGGVGGLLHDKDRSLDHGSKQCKLDMC